MDLWIILQNISFFQKDVLVLFYKELVIPRWVQVQAVFWSRYSYLFGNISHMCYILSDFRAHIKLPDLPSYLRIIEINENIK